MNDNYKPTPNSYLGDVQWLHDPFWGTMEFLFQHMLGMYPRPPDRYEGRFLEALENPDQLEDWFHETEMEDGSLGLFIQTSPVGSDWIGLVETHFRYGEDVSDEDFQRLIKDLVAFARTRPIVDQNAREGAEITDEEIDDLINQNETMEEHDLWASLPTVVREDCGLPHYLWIESLEFLEPEDGDWIPWPAELP